MTSSCKAPVHFVRYAPGFACVVIACSFTGVLVRNVARHTRAQILAEKNWTAAVEADRIRSARMAGNEVAQAALRDLARRGDWGRFRATLGHQGVRADEDRVETALWYAAANGRTTFVERWFAEVGPAPTRGAAVATRLINAAATSEQPSLVRFLLRRGAAPDGDSSDASPLHYAAMRRSDAEAEIARILIAAGADVNAAHRHTGPIARGGPDGLLWTPLMFAAYSGRADVARILLARGANAQATNLAHETALDIARKAHHRSIVVLLETAATDLRK